MNREAFEDLCELLKESDVKEAGEVQQLLEKTYDLAAEISWTLYTKLRGKGFTKEQAMQIVVAMSGSK